MSAITAALPIGRRQRAAGLAPLPTNSSSQFTTEPSLKPPIVAAKLALRHEGRSDKKLVMLFSKVARHDAVRAPVHTLHFRSI
jgi:hypothetical protein